MKSRYEKPFVTIKRYTVITKPMNTTSPQNIVIEDAGALTDNPWFTLGTLNN